MSDIVLTAAAAVPEARLASITRDLSRDLTRAGIPSRLISAPLSEGERGDALTLGQIGLGLITSGAVTAAIGCFKAYLSREPMLTLKFKLPNGVTAEINAKNIDTEAVKDMVSSLVRPTSK